MRVTRLALGDLETNCFIVDDGEGGPAIVIDPAGEPARLIASIADQPVCAVVLTHGHFDHLGAVNEVLDATGAPLLVHELDAGRIISSAADANSGAIFGYTVEAPPADRTLTEGDEVAAGTLRFEVMHTPGHTPGSICLLAPGHVFSGDTLFAGSIGRTDFPGGDMRAMRSSITRLSCLPDDTIVHPGHGPESTIGRERAVNPFFPRG